MGFEYTTENKMDRKIQDKIRELGGVAEIENPLSQVILPVARKEMDTGHDAVYNLRKDHKKEGREDWCDRLPSRTPQRPTLINIAERLQFEELVKSAAQEYSAFTGENVKYDITEMHTPTKE